MLSLVFDRALPHAVWLCRVTQATMREGEPALESPPMLLNRAAHGRLPVVLFVAVASFHFAFAWVSGPATNWRGTTSEFYPLLADAFLAGQTNLLLQPSAELLALPDPYDPAANGPFRLHDASLYHGKYYLYFGPTPAIVLYLPYKVLTGSHIPTRIAIALFCTFGFACSCALFFLLVKREKWDCPPWLGSAAVLSLGTAPAIAFLLMHPSFYEVAIAGGYCFVMAGFLLTAHSLGQDPPRTASLFGAGLCFGLAAGCRPNFALLAILMAALLAFRMRSHKTRVLAFAGPVILCGVLLAVYNYARFQNPLEFGIRYQLAVNLTGPDDHFNHTLEKFLPSLYALVLAPPARWLFWFHRTMGLVWGSPIALLGLCTPWILRYSGVKGSVKLGSTRFIIYGIYACALSTLLVLAFMSYIVGRYTVDFVPEFVLLSLCLLAARWQAIRGLDKSRLVPFRLVVVGAAVYSAVFEICICMLHFHANYDLLTAIWQGGSVYQR